MKRVAQKKRSVYAIEDRNSSIRKRNGSMNTFANTVIIRENEIHFLLECNSCSGLKQELMQKRSEMNSEFINYGKVELQYLLNERLIVIDAINFITAAFYKRKCS